MAKIRRNYGWGCPTCNMQCAGFADADATWQEASIHTTGSGHVTDTFFRIDTQITTIYPQKRDIRVLTALEAPLPQQPEEYAESNPPASDSEERSGRSDQPNLQNKDLKNNIDPAMADFSPEAIRAIDEAAEEYVVTDTKKPDDQVG